jgi:single-strand DNA-binding protein
MQGLNVVHVIGNLTRDVELRHVGQNKTPVTDAGLAVTTKRRTKEGFKDETAFVDVTVWGKMAEALAQYTRKGSPVFFAGRLIMEEWNDKDGNKRSKVKVVAEDMRLLGGNQQQSQQQQAPPKQAPKQQPRQQPEEEYAPDDEIPF